MPLQRIGFKFNYTSVPEDPTSASAHSGSWSENHWDNAGLSANDPLLSAIAIARAGMLPKQAAVIGIRTQQYTIDQNKLVPGGTSTFKTLVAGNQTYDSNLPQDGLRFSALCAGQPKAIRFTAAAIPDDVIKGGEYTGDPAFNRFVVAYINALIRAGLGSVVADFTQPSIRVLGIAPPVIRLETASAGYATNYIKLKRVVDSHTNLPIKGSFLCDSVAGQNYTVEGLDPTAIAGPGGFARRDFIKFAPYAEIKVDRATPRKIGSPFEKYRGRRSKRTR